MYNRSLLIFCILFGLAKYATAQHIIWEKVFGVFSDDQLSGICSLPGGQFYAIGTSDLLGGYSSGYGGAVILKLNENGDTVFLKRLNLLGRTTPYIGHKYGDIYRTVVAAQIPMGTSTIAYPAVVEFNSEGAVLQTHVLTQYKDWMVNNAIPTPDYGLILSGYFNGKLTLPTQMMSMKVNFLGEVEWANKWNPPAQVRGIGKRIFQTKPNEYLITGTLGRRIGGFTFDSLGNQLATKVFYDNPTQYVFITGESTPSSDASIVSTGYYKDAQNEGYSYFGKLDSAGNKLWGGQQRNGFDYPEANKDGSVWCMYFPVGGPMVQLKKFGPDSSAIKSIPIFQSGGFEAIWYQYLPIGNNQVIAVGYRNTNDQSEQFLITKIDSFGVPITAAENQVSKPPGDYRQVVAFPNPATQTVQFKNLEGQGHLRLYNLKGEMLREEDVKPQEAISLHSLSSGEYLWHISTADKKVYTGRILKE